MFALKCEHVRFLQDFMVWPKCSQTETAQTEMSTDRNGPDRNGPDRNGPDRNGPDRNDPDRNGPDRNGPDRNGSDRIGQTEKSRTLTELDKQDVCLHRRCAALKQYTNYSGICWKLSMLLFNERWWIPKRTIAFAML